MESSSRKNENPGTESPTSLKQEDKKQCWVCFCTEDDDLNALWVRPCNCKGSSKWVHQMCLQRWVDEKQKGNPVGKVSCPQCNTEYIIVYPEMGPLIVILDSFNAVVYRACPILAAGVMVGSIYWVAATYGAVTVMQETRLQRFWIMRAGFLAEINASYRRNRMNNYFDYVERAWIWIYFMAMGHDQALELMETIDPIILMGALPTIPVFLILSKLIKWEDTALTFLRRNARKVPVIKYILPSFTLTSPESTGQQPEAIPPLTDPISATRILCSALILPTMATVTGKLLFRSVQSNIQRTILGGIAFLTVKGILKIYHKQQHYIRQSQRKILDYPSDNTPTRTHVQRQDINIDAGTNH